MITKNFKALLQGVLQTGDTKGMVPAKNTSGTTVYIGPSFSSGSCYPYSSNETIRIGSIGSNAGVYLGTGDAPATENDYTLSSVITSGLSAGAPTVTRGIDANGNPYKQIVAILTNSTAADITIKEIGYIQPFFASTTQMQSPSLHHLLLDHTVLASPVTVPANGTVALKYTLKTIIS